VTQSIQAAGITQPERASAHVIDDHVRDLPPEVLSKMPLKPALKRSVNRARQAHQPTNPLTLADLRELQQEFKLTTKGERFLLYDSYEDGELNDDDEEDPEDDPRILIFSTRENLKKLGRSKTWFSDGPFQVCPALFAQLFTIHGLYNDVTFPFVCALLPNKKERSYTKVFQEVKQKAVDLNFNFPEPETVVSDFELGIVNSSQNVYPHSDVRLCFFHLGQSAYR